MTITENTKTKVRKRRCGLKDICVAAVETNTEELYKAGTPVRLSRAISATIKDTYEVEYLYSDDSIEEQVETYIKTEIELEVSKLSPADYAMLFDAIYDAGFLIQTDEDKAKPVAVGFRAKNTAGQYEFFWYYLGYFTRPDEKFETIKDKKTTQSTTLSATFYQREFVEEEKFGDETRKVRKICIKVDESNLADDEAEAAAAIKDWFSEVKEHTTNKGEAA